jgi:hypothetical protein
MNGFDRSAERLGLHRGLALLVTGIGLLATSASADDSELCLAAAQDASRINDVPISVLYAVSLVETGRARNGELRPWPWTINVEGEGHWFEDRETALSFAQQTRDRGIRSFDVGCFQVNYRWHGENFVSIEQMFDPMANATYAASFLKELEAEKGDWSSAAGAYHSRNEEFAAGYRSRFDSFRQAAIAAGADERDQSAPLRLAGLRDVPSLPNRNDFPLLQQRDGIRSLGSLVTLSNGG